MLGSLGNQRYILYIDILGFKKIVKEKSVEEVYKVVDDVLKLYYEFEDDGYEFSIIYFSDTIVIYQNNERENEKDIDVAYYDTWYIARMIYCRLLSIGIPIRAVIAFGEFIVKDDSRNKNLVFFGKALIEAYEAEKKENWIGIIMVPSAYMYHGISEARIEHECGNFLRRKDNCLMINPFIAIRTYSRYYESFRDVENQGMRDELEIELKAFSYIYKEAIKFSFETFCDRVAEKYLNTLLFIKEVMKKDMYEWTEKSAKSIDFI